jgi:hypothetical protein
MRRGFLSVEQIRIYTDDIQQGLQTGRESRIGALSRI